MYPWWTDSRKKLITRPISGLRTLLSNRARPILPRDPNRFVCYPNHSAIFVPSVYSEASVERPKPFCATCEWQCFWLDHTLKLALWSYFWSTLVVGVFLHLLQFSFCYMWNGYLSAENLLRLKCSKRTQQNQFKRQNKFKVVYHFVSKHGAEK